MPRKGSRKVRTGCLTCKARKVKCDEAKPQCNRCTSTGRQCDGYATSNSRGGGNGGGEVGATGTGAAGARLVWRRPRQLFHGIGSAAEGRALQFFCEIAGPFLPGVTDPYFWTQLVMQFCSFEPAVRHSVVAISSLYEQSQKQQRLYHEQQQQYLASNGSSKKALPTPARIRDNALALRHYNAAIAELKTMDNPSLVLLVCILFICIEFLQAHRQTAIRHCRHGILILQSNSAGPAWVREHLVPLYRRLSIYPFFFGVGDDGFPSLAALEHPIPDAFTTYSDARFMMDDIFSRTLRLVRCGDEYRFGDLRYTPVPASLLAEQETINYRLHQWQARLAHFEAQKRATPPPDELRPAEIEEEYQLRPVIRVYLSISYEICRIWANAAFNPYEMGYDRYLDSFRRLLQQFKLLQATLPPETSGGGSSHIHGHNSSTCGDKQSKTTTDEEASSSSLPSPSPGGKSDNQKQQQEQKPRQKYFPRFIFEMGFLPMTFFVVTKCRMLHLRLAALRCMKAFGVPRPGPNRWAIDTCHEVARRVIEMEHGVKLDNQGQMRSSTPAPAFPGLPPEEKRIRDTRTDYNECVHADASGRQLFVGRIVRYFMRSPEDTMYTYTEFFPIEGRNVSLDGWEGPDKTWTRELEIRMPTPPREVLDLPQ